MNDHPLFRELAADMRVRLYACATTREVARGNNIFTKGDPGTCLFAVCSGIVQVTTPSTEGKSAVLNLIGEGEVVGEIALLDGQPRTADAIASTDCTLLIIERRDFVPLLRSQPDIAIRLMEILCSRLRRTTEQVEDLMFLNSTTRIAKVLFRLSNSTGAKGVVEVSQAELSSMVGLSREMINKQLGIWAREKIVKSERRRIVVLRPDLLLEIAADQKNKYLS